MSDPANNESVQSPAEIRETNSNVSQTPGATEAKAGAPTYFHLLWNHELDNLAAAILDSILARRDQVMENSPHKMKTSAQTIISTKCAVSAISVAATTMATSYKNLSPALRSRSSRRMNWTLIRTANP